MAFCAIPAIDIKKGSCVRLKQGEMRDATIYSTDPVQMAKRWISQNATRIHVVDLDGAFSGNQKNYTDIEEDIFDQSDYSTPGWERAKIETSNKNLENFEPKIITSSQAKYSKGSIVIHKKFGQGRVESIDGKKLTINFGESGTRKVMENFVESLN